MNARAASVGLFCISGALLSYEFLLMRLLSLAYWGHFAGLVFSIAMLGLAASGLFLHFFRKRVCSRPSFFFVLSAGLFGVVAPAAFYVSQFIPFAPYLLAWSIQEYLLLALRITLFFIPFFLSGIAAGIPFVAQLLPASRLYWWSMLGSATPIAPLLLGMIAFHPVRLLAVVSMLGAVSALLGCRSWRARSAWAFVGVASSFAAGAIPFHYSEYKPLPKTLLLPESRVVEERPHWQGIVHTVRSPHTRYLPGLSLNFDGNLPRSELVFIDGAGMDVVFDAKKALGDPAFLRLSPEALAYELKEKPSVLILNGGTLELLRALSRTASSVVWLDEMGGRADAIRAVWERFGTSPVREGRVRPVEDEARRFLQNTDERFDLIFLSFLESHASSTAGAASLDPSYLVTSEGISALLDRLSETGQAVFTLWVENPPRTGVRLSALVIDALRGRGISEPSKHILALRSWSTLTFYVARAPFPRTAIDHLKKFADENSFDLVHYDGMPHEEANKFNMIPDEPYVAAFASLLAPAANTFRRHWPFNLQPVTDDAPFFGHHFRWAAVPEFVERMGDEWVPYVEWGYLLLVASLVVSAGLGFIFVVMPCLTTRVRPGPSVFVFLLLGFAYMFVEMWAVYRLLYLVGYPQVTFAVVLAFMLASSAAGAVVLGRCGKSCRTTGTILIALGGALLLSNLLFEVVATLTFKQTLVLRALVAGLWMAIPAFFMGFPFPFALEHKVRTEEIPWALGLNGLGSVLGSLAATLLAVHFGLNVLAGAALLLYVLAGIAILKARPN